MRIIKRTTRFKKDYKKASKNQHGKNLDIELGDIGDAPSLKNTEIIPFWVIGKTIEIAISDLTWC